MLGDVVLHDERVLTRVEPAVAVPRLALVQRQGLLQTQQPVDERPVVDFTVPHDVPRRGVRRDAFLAEALASPRRGRERTRDPVEARDVLEQPVPDDAPLHAPDGQQPAGVQRNAAAYVSSTSSVTKVAAASTPRRNPSHSARCTSRGTASPSPAKAMRCLLDSSRAAESKRRANGVAALALRLKSGAYGYAPAAGAPAARTSAPRGARASFRSAATRAPTASQTTRASTDGSMVRAVARAERGGGVSKRASSGTKPFLFARAVSSRQVRVRCRS